MSERDDELVIRRILVALDASHHSIAALEAAAELAASLKAELEGLFIEDIGLLQAAALPVTQEVRFPFDSVCALDPARLVRELHAQETQTGRALLAACRARKIKGSFRVLRGSVTPAVLQAAQRADLLSLGTVSRPLVQSGQLGSTARTVASQAPGSVLLVRRDTRIRPPVLVALGDDPAARRTLLMGAHLARMTGSYLTAVIVTERAEQAQQMRAQAVEWLRKQRLLVRYQRLSDRGAASLGQAVLREKSGVFVLGGALMEPDALQQLLERVECPVLLVR
jgi:nucleotide-binding universal stress UspA family protein